MVYDFEIVVKIMSKNQLIIRTLALKDNDNIKIKSYFFYNYTLNEYTVS